MSKATFLRALKSTIDKIGNDLALAQSPALKFVDLDDVTAVEEIMTSTATAFVWEMSTFKGVPRDPLYEATFNMGVRTTDDAANYNILGFAGLLSDTFDVDKIIDIKDYSGVNATSSQGALHITYVTTNPQVFDRVSGIRMLSISAKAQRWL